MHKPTACAQRNGHHQRPGDTYEGRLGDWEPSITAQTVCLATVERKPIEWVWPGYIPRGTITLIDGDPGLGKSFVTLDIAARVSRGRVMPPEPAGPSGVDAGAVLLLNAEDDLARTIKPRLEEMDADLSLIHAMTEVVSDIRRPPDLPGDLDLIEQFVLAHRVRLAVLDPIMAYLGGTVDSHKDSDIRRVMHGLKSMAERTQAAVLVVRHLNKLVNVDNPVYRGGGSIGIIGAARSALLIGKHPEDDTKRVLARTKGNLAVEPMALSYSIESSGNCATVAWLGEIDLRAEDLVTRRKDREGESRSTQRIKADGNTVLGIMDRHDANKAGMKVREIGKRLRWGRERLDRACTSLTDDGVCLPVEIDSVSGRGKSEKAVGIRRR